MKILICVLSGYTLDQVGMVFGITGTRVSQVISRLIRKYYPEIYKEIKTTTILVNVRNMREKYKNRLLCSLRGNLPYE